MCTLYITVIRLVKYDYIRYLIDILNDSHNDEKLIAKEIQR